MKLELVVSINLIATTTEEGFFRNGKRNSKKFSKRGQAHSRAKSDQQQTFVLDQSNNNIVFLNLQSFKDHDHVESSLPKWMQLLRF